METTPHSMDDSTNKPSPQAPVLGYEMPSTFRERRGQRPHSPLGYQVLILAGVGTIVACLPIGSILYEHFYAATFYWISGGLIWFFLKDDRIIQLEQPIDREKPKHWRRIVWGLLIFSILSTVRLDQCSHGTFLIVGPFSYTDGYWCGNNRHFKSLPMLLVKDIRDR